MLKEKSLKTLLLKASLLAGVYVCVVKERKTDVQATGQKNKKSTEYCQSKTVDVCLKQKGLKKKKNIRYIATNKIV